MTVFLLVCFTTDQIAYGNLALPKESPLNASSKLPAVNPSLFSIHLPQSFGTIQKVFRGSKDQTVIHIQDAHVNEEAQRNIASILGFLSQHYGVYPIYLEGASGELVHRPLSLYPEKTARELAADFFLRQGKLSGPEYYALTQCPECHLIGAEDKVLYEENRRSYLEAVKIKDKLQPVLSSLRTTLEKLSAYIFTAEFQRLRKMKDEFHASGNHFLPYLRFLYGMTKKYNEAKRFPKVKALFRRQRINTDLFQEIEKMEELLKEKLLQDHLQKELARGFEILETYEKIFHFSLTRKDAEFFYSNRDFFKSEKIEQFLRPLLRRYHFNLKLEELALVLLDKPLNEFEKFYALALKRDEVLAGQVLKDMEKRKEKISILLTGGFHTPGLTRILEKQGISYLVLMPQITSPINAKNEAARYDQAMSNPSLFHEGAQSNFVNDPRYQLQPPRLLPSIHELPGLIQRFPELDFFVLGMLATAIQDIRLNGVRRKTISDFLANDLTGDEKRLAEMIYRPIHHPAALSLRNKEGRGAYLSADASLDGTFAVGATWSPSKNAHFENKTFQDSSFFGFKTKDKVFTQIRLITHPDDYSMAETHLLQSLKQKPRNIRSKHQVRSEVRCGNEGVLVERQDSDSSVLPSVIQSFMEGMGRITKIRGEQAAGRALFVQKGEEIGVLRERVINPKRGDLPSILGRVFNRKILKNLLLRKIKPAPATYLVMEHYRYGTSSAPAVNETHPHQWMPERIVSQWTIQEGQWLRAQKRLANLISHNGDFDSWNIFGKEQPFEPIGLWLERVLHTPNNTQGDSPKIAGMMDLLLTQGMWDASVRLAYQFVIAESLLDAFGGEAPSKEAPNTAPSNAIIREWARTFEKIFEKYQKMLLLGNVKNFSDISETGKKIFHRELFDVFREEHTLKDWPQEKRRQFIITATHLFFENDLYKATQMFLSRAKGSFGLVTVSTLEPEKVVLSARGQPISIGFHPEAKMVAYASEAAALKIPFGNQGMIPYRFDLDQVAGEIAEVSIGKMRIYSEKKGRELSEEEMSRSGRLIEMRDNPYVSPLSDVPPEDPVGSDLRDIPKVLSTIREEWRDPDSFNSQTAAEFSKFLVEKAKMRYREDNSEELDVLITGMEVSQWIGEQFSEDLKQIFPRLRVGSVSANKILKDIQRKKISYVGPNTLVLAISQSGQTFPTLNAAIALNALNRLQSLSGRKVFVLTGELDSLMGTAVGQHYYKEAEFSLRIFTNGSGRRPSEPSTVAAASAIQTLTELLLRLARELRQKFPDDSPFGMTLQKKDIKDLERLRDGVIDRGVPAITGVTARGDPIDSSENKNLIAMGQKWGQHVLEPAVAWGLSAFYVAMTVIFGVPLFSTIAHEIISWGGLEAFKTYAIYAGRGLDALLYIFLPFVMTLGLRWFQSRKLLARMGKRTLVIGDIPYVHQLLESYASKLLSLSYAIATIEIHGANPGDHMLHRFGHRVTRGTLALLGRPDSRLDAYKAAESAVLMTGKQAKGVQNYKVGAEIITIGHNPSVNSNALDEASVLWTHTIPKSALVQELYENRFASLERLIAGYVLLHAMAKKVSGFSPLRYDMSRSQSGTRISTTASPVSLPDLFSEEAIHLKNGELLDHAVDLPFKVLASTYSKLSNSNHSFNGNGKRESKDPVPVGQKRSEMRLAPPGLLEALDEKSHFERTVFLNQRLRLLKRVRKLERKGFDLEQALLHMFPAISSDVGELVFNYHARRHSAAFMERFFKQVKDISKGVPVYIFRDPETSINDWNQIKRLAPRGVPIRFVNPQLYPDLERFVTYRRKMKKMSASEIIQVLDESQIFRSRKERRWSEATFLGAARLSQNTILVLGAKDKISDARHLRVFGLITAAINSRKVIRSSA